MPASPRSMLGQPAPAGPPDPSIIDPETCTVPIGDALAARHFSEALACVLPDANDVSRVNAIESALSGLHALGFKSPATDLHPDVHDSLLSMANCQDRLASSFEAQAGSLAELAEKVNRLCEEKAGPAPCLPRHDAPVLFARLRRAKDNPYCQSIYIVRDEFATLLELLDRPAAPSLPPGGEEIASDMRKVGYRSGCGSKAGEGLAWIEAVLDAHSAGGPR